MNPKHIFPILLSLIIHHYAQDIQLTGTITGNSGQPVANAQIALSGLNLETESGPDGTYSLVGNVVISGGFGEKGIFVKPRINGRNLSFSVMQNNQHVHIDVHDLRGRCIATVLDNILKAGIYSIPLDNIPLSSQVNCIVFRVNGNATVLKQIFIAGSRKIGSASKSSALGCVKKTTHARIPNAIDTLTVSKLGYKAEKKAIDAYTGTHDFILTPSGFTVTTHAIDVSAPPVDDKDGVGWGNAPHPQIILKPWQDSCFAIAWNDKNDAVHISKITSDYQLSGDDIVFVNTTLGGFTITSGGFGLTAVRDSMLFVVGLSENGTVAFETQLIGFKPQWEYEAKFDPMAFGSSRLHFADNTYASYYAHQQNFSQNPDSAEVHQGDMLVFLDTDGEIMDNAGGWDWGTSHSLDERLSHDGEAFVTVSLGDAYPKGITFQRVNEISKKTIMQLDANMGGWANGDLGGLVILKEGYVVAFLTPQNRDTTDAGFMCVDADGTVLRTVWLTERTKVEAQGKILNRVNAAQFGDIIFMTWNIYDKSEDADSTFAVAVNFEGEIIIGPDKISDTFNIGDDFVTLPNGDVAWAIEENGALKIIRIIYTK